VTTASTRLSAVLSLPRCVALVLLAACAAAHADPDTLWRLIDTRCVPESLAGAAPVPCVRVDLAPDRDHGWVALKDIRGALQYLLMPTARITGIENPGLEAATATNYVAQAWRERDLLDLRHGSPLARDAVSLTINSRTRRSQNQLHIHISCVRPELRARLLAAQSGIAPTWAPLPGGWLRHAWFVRRVEAPTLEGVNPFADVAANVPGAAADMGAMTIGVVAATFSDGKDGFVLMASAFDPADPSSGSAEDDVQDHSCAIVGPEAASAPQ
jgi:CDP-diacylglycerol pyrophosphatase